MCSQTHHPRIPACLPLALLSLTRPAMPCICNLRLCQFKPPLVASLQIHQSLDHISAPEPPILHGSGHCKRKQKAPWHRTVPEDMFSIFHEFSSYVHCFLRFSEHSEPQGASLGPFLSGEELWMSDSMVLVPFWSFLILFDPFCSFRRPRSRDPFGPSRFNVLCLKQLGSCEFLAALG